MAPAVRVLNGEGITTNWLVKQDLLPYTVPRPDDLRFPGLLYIMALAFFLFGTSYSTALGLMFAIHMGFLILTYLACRRFFGPTIALLTLLLTGISPLQLLWNTHIYTESLFGLVLAGVLLWSVSVHPRKRIWWVGAGLGIGLLGLVKIHALLFLPGFLVMSWVYRKEAWCRPSHAILAIALALAIMSPWFYRNYMLFGSPVHSAQNAWIFRYTLQDPTDLNFSQFMEKHGPFVFFKKLLQGIKVLFLNWEEYDHGLARIPLLLALIGIVRKQAFFNPFILTGFFLVFLGSAYTSYPFWIGIRFWTPLIPFVVAYGLSQMTPWIGRLAHLPALPFGRPPLLRTGLGLLLGLGLAYPAFYPLKFYLRQPKAPPDHGDSLRAAYITALEKIVPPEEIYLAASLGQFSFLTQRNCLNLDDEYHMEKWVPKMMNTLKPSYLALKSGEDTVAHIKKALALIQARGYKINLLQEEGLAAFYRIEPVHGTKPE